MTEVTGSNRNLMTSRHWRKALCKQTNSKTNTISEKTVLTLRGGEWYPENRGSRKLLIGSRNLGSFCDESRNLVFHLFLSVSESRIFFRKVSESRICLVSRGSLAKVIALREQSQCC